MLTLFGIIGCASENTKTQKSTDADVSAIKSQLLNRVCVFAWLSAVTGEAGVIEGVVVVVVVVVWGLCDCMIGGQLFRLVSCGGKWSGNINNMWAAGIWI